MSDLRAMLGDRYDDVIIKATKRALFNYPNLPISIEQHEALAGQALTAVLPDLLAQAWDEGAAAAWERSTAAVNAERYHWRSAGEPLNPYRQEANRGVGTC